MLATAKPIAIITMMKIGRYELKSVAASVRGMIGMIAARLGFASRST
jgi:hypothetical protein